MTRWANGAFNHGASMCHMMKRAMHVHVLWTPDHCSRVLDLGAWQQRAVHCFACEQFGLEGLLSPNVSAGYVLADLLSRNGCHAAVCVTHYAPPTGIPMRDFLCGEQVYC